MLSGFQLHPRWVPLTHHSITHTEAEDLSYLQHLTILLPGSTPYDSLYGQARLERGTFFHAPGI